MSHLRDDSPKPINGWRVVPTPSAPEGGTLTNRIIVRAEMMHSLGPRIVHSSFVRLEDLERVVPEGWVLDWDGDWRGRLDGLHERPLKYDKRGTFSISGFLGSATRDFRLTRAGQLPEDAIQYARQIALQAKGRKPFFHGESGELAVALFRELDGESAAASEGDERR